MLKKISLTILCILTLNTIQANKIIKPNESDFSVLGKKKIDFGCSESDAKIFINGKLLGKGNLEIVVPSKGCITVVVKKVGFLTEKIEFCNKKGMPAPPKSYYMELKRDDAYDASIQTDIANVDIELKSTIDKDKAWKLINQIVLSNIDVIEMTDKETGYLRTAWSLKTFKQNTIRTRIIIKQTSDNPLIFKVKLVSEESGLAMTSVKSDELYKEWDRVLRSYSNVIPELQARIK
ncbi:hypothetical protein [Lutibacter sp. B1]|uniref:hypothetical protein n=1 Tax=Lutibacter sp. B1 TaxID=2725996 RepID=UPI0014565510|nr:hypothetical protein [Lutibacter sp. B1]NLP57749.1 hypothetical protein [Lutibacter sp. B1]